MWNIITKKTINNEIQDITKDNSKNNYHKISIKSNDSSGFQNLPSQFKIYLEQKVEQYLDLCSIAKPYMIKDIFETAIKTAIDLENCKRRKTNEYLKEINIQNEKTAVLFKFFNDLANYSNEKYKDVVNLFSTTIQIYFQSPWLDNINYDTDTSKLHAIVRFKEAKYNYFKVSFNIDYYTAKEIINKKNYSLLIELITDFGIIKIQNIILNDTMAFAGNVSGLKDNILESIFRETRKFKKQDQINISRNINKEINNKNILLINTIEKQDIDYHNINDKIISQNKVKLIKDDNKNNQTKEFKNIVDLQANKIKELQNKLLEKEDETKDLINSFNDKLKKLEKKISKQKVIKSKIPMNVIVEKTSLKKDDGVLVKRESFDDF